MLPGLPNHAIVGGSLETLLMTQVAEQDAAAFMDVYELTVVRVLGVIRGLVHRPEDAEEVLCEVYLDVWRRAADYDPKRGSVGDWLVGSARRRALERLRLRRTRHDQPAMADGPGLDGPGLGGSGLDGPGLGGAGLEAATRSALPLTEWPLATVKSMIRESLAALPRTLEFDAG